MEHPVEIWDKVPIIVTSNNLPRVLKFPTNPDKNEDDYNFSAR